MEIQHPLRILIPVCFELECDVFLNVIENLIGRSKLDAHFLDNAFKVGMSGETFLVELEDVTLDWRHQKSNEQQIRHTKMLGYWASANFPVLGKKFFGLSWQPPQRSRLQVVGRAQEFRPEEIDSFVFKKLKLRLIELYVSPSTYQKVKRFAVDIPVHLGKKNEIEVSEKIKSLDIDDESAEEGWLALKLGSHVPSESISGPKRKACRDNGKANDTLSISSKSAKRILLETKTTYQNTNITAPNTSPKAASKKTHVNTDIAKDTVNSNNTDESNCDPIGTVLLEIRNDVGRLADFVRDAFTRQDESANRQDEVNVFVINQKDGEIAQLKASKQELLQQNRSLANDQVVLKEKSDRQLELLHALQKGIDSTSKLQEQAERDLSMSLNAIETMKSELTKLKDENEDHDKKNEAMKENMSQLGIEYQQMVKELQSLRIEQASNGEKLFAVDAMEIELMQLNCGGRRNKRSSFLYLK